MLVPEAKSIHIQSRHEIGREWYCSGCDKTLLPGEGVTWHPVEPMDNFREFVVYDSNERNSESAIVLGIYFEDIFPQIEAEAINLCNYYYNELMVYTPHFSKEMGGLVSSIPLELVKVSWDENEAGDSTDLSLGVVEVGCLKGRFFYEGLGARQYPVNLQKGDKLVLRPLIFNGHLLDLQNEEARKRGHQELGVLPIYGHFPVSGNDASGNPGLWDYEEWSRRLFLNVILDVVETKIVESKDYTSLRTSNESRITPTNITGNT